MSRLLLAATCDPQFPTVERSLPVITGSNPELGPQLQPPTGGLIPTQSATPQVHARTWISVLRTLASETEKPPYAGDPLRFRGWALESRSSKHRHCRKFQALRL